MTTHEAKFYKENDKEYDKKYNRKEKAMKRHGMIIPDTWAVKPTVPYCSMTYGGEDNINKNPELDYFFKTYGHPANWKIVLEHFPKLHLCLAHFGGDLEWGDKSMAEWAYASSKGMPTREWINTIIYLINYYDNVYTDISCLNIFNDNIRVALKHMLSLINNSTSINISLKSLIAQIKKLFYNNGKQRGTQNSANDEKPINPFERLKDKLIFGSDWYLTYLTPIAENAEYSNYCRAFKKLFYEVDNTGELWERVSLINPWKCYSLSIDKLRNMRNALPGLAEEVNAKYYGNAAQDALERLEKLYCDHIYKQLNPNEPCKEELTCRKEQKPCKKQ
jgi:hypothetical protein